MAKHPGSHLSGSATKFGGGNAEGKVVHISPGDGESRAGTDIGSTGRILNEGGRTSGTGRNRGVLRGEDMTSEVS